MPSRQGNEPEIDDRTTEKKKTAPLFTRLAMMCVVMLFLSMADFISFKGVLPNSLWRSIRINNATIQHELGHNYWIKANTDRFHSGSTPSVGVVIEDGKPLSSGNEIHDDIRVLGNGRYSFWKNGVYFSASDNTNPIDNGRQYLIQVPYALPSAWAYILYGFTFLGWVVMIGYLMFVSPGYAYHAKQKIQRWATSDNTVVRYFTLMLEWIWVNIVPGVSVTILVLLVLYAAGEIYLRIKLPFNQPYWSSQFDQRYGWNFIPGATVNLTNYTDFWTSTPANSLGFLDREPPPVGKPPNTCRVAFIGDSMVEAAQVPIKDKMQVRFEEIANRESQDGRTFQTVAFGFSGTGQVNQIPFYDVFAKPLKPNVVVLVFVANDFANNSTTLESIRNGWAPLHPPRLFFEYNHQTQTFSAIEIDPNWQNYLLPILPPVRPNISRVTSWLSQHSYLYNWMNAMFFASSPKLSTFLSGNLPISEIYKARLNEIKKMDKYTNDFGNWDPTSIFFDNMFAEEQELPPAFEDAIAETGYALDQFKERAEKDNFKLVVLTNFSVSAIDGGRRKMYDRIFHLANERDIPVADQYDYMISKGFGYDDVHFPHDGHLNVLGHQTSAEALWEYFRSHPEICD